MAKHVLIFYFFFNYRQYNLESKVFQLQDYFVPATRLFLRPVLSGLCCKQGT